MSTKRNSALSEMALSFGEQIALGSEFGTSISPAGSAAPSGVEFLDDGRVRLNFFAPKASSVALMGMTGETPLAMSPDGVWSVTLDAPPKGLSPLFFAVDGNTVINPLAPIGFGSSRPCNMMEAPDEGVDFFYCKNVPHGAVSQEFYYSAALGEWESCLVYTPPGYMRGSGEYPVLYLQHGHGENERCWTYQGKINFIADNLIAEGSAVPCIIVMNNGMVQTERNGARVIDSSLLGRLLIEDCIPFIERTYRVKSDRLSRAMAGLSMGSMQTSIITMKHPELFAWAGVFSGFIRVLKWLSSEDDSHLAALDDAARFASDFKLFFRAIGEKDPFMSTFSDEGRLMAEKGLAPGQCLSHIEKIYPGSHEWNVWRLCARDFLRMIFKD